MPINLVDFIGTLRLKRRGEKELFSAGFVSILHHFRPALRMNRLVEALWLESNFDFEHPFSRKDAFYNIVKGGL